MGKVSDATERTTVVDTDSTYLFSSNTDYQSTLANIIEDLGIPQLDADGKLPIATIPDALVDGGGAGDVIGPASSTDGRVALFDGGTGKAIKVGAAGQLVPPGGASGYVLAKSASGDHLTEWVSNGAGSGDVTGPSSTTDSLPTLFNGGTGKVIKAGVAGQLVPTGGSIGQFLKKTSGTNYATEWATAAGGVTSVNGDVGVVVLDYSDVGAASTAQGTLAAAALPNTVTDVRTALTAAAADGTQGPLMGAANAAAGISQTKANLIAQWNAELVKNEMVAVVVPYAAGPAFPTISAGAVLTMGSTIDTNIYGVGQATTVGLDQVPLAFAVTDADGLVYEAEYVDAWDLMQTGRTDRYAPTTVAFVSTVLTFDAATYRNVHTSIVANSTIAATCWDNILDGEEEVLLYVSVGATTYTLTPASGVDGYVVSDMPTFAINSIQEFRMGKINGVPSLRWLAGYAVAAAAVAGPVYIGETSELAFTDASPNTISLHASAQAGDLAVCWLSNPNSSTLAQLPTSQAVAWTDSGLGGDANSPSVRLCSKVLVAGDVDLVCGGGARMCFVAIFRKAGGTPTLALTSYAKSAASSTTTLDWVTLAVAQDFYVATFIQFLGTDDATVPLRDETPVVDSYTGATSKCYWGVSTLQDYPSDDLPADTTTKIGVQGRSVTSQAVIY